MPEERNEQDLATEKDAPGRPADQEQKSIRFGGAEFPDSGSHLDP